MSVIWSREGIYDYIVHIHVHVHGGRYVPLNYRESDLRLWPFVCIVEVSGIGESIVGGSTDMPMGSFMAHTFVFY